MCLLCVSLISIVSVQFPSRSVFSLAFFPFSLSLYGSQSENWASVASLALAPPHILPTLALPLDRAIPQVSTQDIGKIAAKYLTIPSSSLSPTGPTIVQLSGPRDVSPIDIAATFEKIGGKKVTAVGVEDKDFESTLEKQVPIHVAANLSEMMRGINSSKINWVEGENVVQEKGSTEIEVTLREMAV